MTRILTINELYEQRNESTTNLPLINCRVLMSEDEKTNTGIVVLPSDIEASNENALIIQTVLQDFISKLDMNGKIGYAIGQMFAGDYCMDESFFDNTSMCIEGYGQLGNEEMLTRVAEYILIKFSIDRALLIMGNNKNELMLEKENGIKRRKIME